MSQSTERAQAVDRAWQELRRAPFPDSLRGATFAGADVWLIEWDIAGCVVRWIDDGVLDAEDGALLRSRVEDLGRVVPEIGEPAGGEYCRRLRRLALLVSEDLPRAR
ncbi:hypothetical protein [Streptomyces sp. NPDC097619]|uniref:hypothetical protein n=1 Tax=Streptomyces sp. NPDC097619 TaxID=3157228 RepID=UPI00331E4C58